MFFTSDLNFSTNEQILKYKTSIQQKLKSKKSAHEFRYGSPKLRDELRNKCRIRIKDARKESFQEGRALNENNRGLITKIIREELANLEDDIKLQELIFQELINEFDESFIDDLEKEENYLCEISEMNIVFCPICQKSDLKVSPGILTCNCGISFSFNGTIDSFNKKLQLLINQHEIKCDELLIFFTEPNATNLKYNLSVFCDKCDTIMTF